MKKNKLLLFTLFAIICISLVSCNKSADLQDFTLDTSGFGNDFVVGVTNMDKYTPADGMQADYEFSEGDAQDYAYNKLFISDSSSYKTIELNDSKGKPLNYSVSEIYDLGKFMLLNVRCYPKSVDLSIHDTDLSVNPIVIGSDTASAKVRTDEEYLYKKGTFETVKAGKIDVQTISLLYSKDSNNFYNIDTEYHIKAISDSSVLATHPYDDITDYIITEENGKLAFKEITLSTTENGHWVDRYGNHFTKENDTLYLVNVNGEKTETKKYWHFDDITNIFYTIENEGITYAAENGELKQFSPSRGNYDSSAYYSYKSVYASKFMKDGYTYSGCTRSKVTVDENGMDYIFENVDLELASDSYAVYKTALYTLVKNKLVKYDFETKEASYLLNGESFSSLSLGGFDLDDVGTIVLTNHNGETVCFDIVNEEIVNTNLGRIFKYYYVFD